MNKNRRRFAGRLQLALDIPVLVLAYCLSVWLWLFSLRKNGANMASGNPLLPAVEISLSLILMGLFGLYSGSGKRPRRQNLLVAEAMLTQLFVMGGLLFLYHLDDFSRGVLFVYTVLGTLLVCLKRYLTIRLSRLLFPRRELRVVVAGTGPLARAFARDLQALSEENTQPLDEIRVIDGFVGTKTDDLPWLGGFDALDTLLENPDVDEVVAALSLEDYNRMRQVIGCCERHGTKLSIIPFYNDIMPSSPSVELVGSSKLINLRANPLDNLTLAFIKRAFDLLISSTLLILLSPLFLLIAAGIRLSGPGPVLFRQERVGRHKRPFVMYKFRSMKVNARQDTGWTTDSDDRRTRFGAFLRRYSLDEFPQLFNVLKGDMSLIGPRPEIPFYVERFKDSVPLYMVKHQVRPGMTGWAQVNGLRGDTSIPKRIEYDVWYIENWSIRLDARILLRTVFGGMRNNERNGSGKAG